MWGTVLEFEVGENVGDKVGDQSWGRFLSLRQETGLGYELGDVS